MFLKFLLLIPTLSFVMVKTEAKIRLVEDNRPIDYSAINVDIDQNGLWDAKVKKDPLSSDFQIQLAYTDASNYTSMNVVSVTELNPTPFPYNADMLAVGKFVHTSSFDYFTIKNFNNQNSRYIGILLVKNNVQYCAWIQILPYGTTSLGLGDYAWEDDKTKCMTAGQAVNLSNPLLPFLNTELLIYPTPANAVIFIKGNQSPVNINILNSLGEIVLRYSQISSDTPIDISNIPIGIYYIFIQENNTVIRKKLLISR